MSTYIPALHLGDELGDLKHINSIQYFRALPPALQKIMQLNMLAHVEFLRFTRGEIISEHAIRKQVISVD